MHKISMVFQFYEGTLQDCKDVQLLSRYDYLLLRLSSINF